MAVALGPLVGTDAVVPAGAAALAVSGLALDSRTVRPGDLFAALPGVKADGASFIAAAAAAGAVAVLGTAAAASAAAAAGLPLIAAEKPHRALAHIAARFFPRQPAIIAAVTGTNGKTSIAAFLRQIFARSGHRAASLGTLGVIGPDGAAETGFTTPDAIALHRTLDRLSGDGITHLAMEASSHGLDQHRLDGVRVRAAGFTNITRDHLDYHGTFENYRAAKERLFAELLPQGGPAVINVDADHADAFVAAAKARGAQVMTVGEHGSFIRLLHRTPSATGQALTLACDGNEYPVALPLAGLFQAANALVAAGLAIACGEKPVDVFGALDAIEGAPGRLQRVAETPAGAAVYVDYAHTPDAIATVLTALRPHVTGRLHIVFGCGGDRDPGKRPLMGEAAARHADVVYVTDDNPRTEEAALIRKAAIAGVEGAGGHAIEIGDRAGAIRAAVAALAPGDLLVIAGKGHERGQIIGREVRPFDDTAEAVAAVRDLTGGAP